ATPAPELRPGLGRIREGRLDRHIPHRFELGIDLGLELVERVVGHDVVQGEPLARPLQRIALAPGVELALGSVLARVAARMADEAVGERLDEGGALAAAHALERRADGVAYGPDVAAVDRLAGHL